MEPIDRVYHAIKSSLQAGRQPGSAKNIARMASVTPDAVRPLLADIERRGWVLVTRNPGQYVANSYEIDPAELAAPPVVESKPKIIRLSDDIPTAEIVAKTSRIHQHNPWQIRGGAYQVSRIMAKGVEEGSLPSDINFGGIGPSPDGASVRSPECPVCGWPFAPLPGETRCVDCLSLSS